MDNREGFSNKMVQRSRFKFGMLSPWIHLILSRMCKILVPLLWMTPLIHFIRRALIVHSEWVIVPLQYLTEYVTKRTKCGPAGNNLLYRISYIVKNTNWSQITNGIQKLYCWWNTCRAGMVEKSKIFYHSTPTSSFLVHSQQLFGRRLKIEVVATWRHN